MKFCSTHSYPLFSVIIAILMVLSVSVHPALAAESVQLDIDKVEATFAEVDAGMYAGSTLSELPLIKENQISAVTLDEVEVGSAATREDSDVELVTVDDGIVHVHVQNPVSDLSDTPSDLSQERAVLPSELTDDAELSQLVSDMTTDGYIYTDTSRHQYESSTKVQNLGRNPIAAANLAIVGIQVSETDPSTLITREDVTYYSFTSPETKDRRTMMVSQVIGADGVTFIGDRSIVVEGFDTLIADGKYSEMWESIKEGWTGLTDTIAEHKIATIVIILLILIILILACCGVFSGRSAITVDNARLQEQRLQEQRLQEQRLLEDNPMQMEPDKEVPYEVVEPDKEVPYEVVEPEPETELEAKQMTLADLMKAKEAERKELADLMKAKVAERKKLAERKELEEAAEFDELAEAEEADDLAEAEAKAMKEDWHAMTVIKALESKINEIDEIMKMRGKR